MPNVEAIRLWVEDLRTTGVQQGKWRLRSEVGDCCLARACEVYARATGRGAWERNDDFGLGFRDGQDCFATSDLPHGVKNWLGLNCNNPPLVAADGTHQTAQAMNDRYGNTFWEIADAIERTYLAEPVP